MRFSLTDLLLITTITAIYCAGLTALPSNTPPGFSSFISILPLLITPIGCMLIAGRNQARIGQASIRWRGKNWWVPHAMYLSLFAVYVAWGAAYRQNVGPIVPAMLLAHHVMFMTWSGCAAGANGMLLGPSLLRWSDYEFEVDHEKRTLRFSRKRDKDWKQWSLPRGGEGAIPHTHLEPLAALISEKQPTTDDADQTGDR